MDTSQFVSDARIYLLAHSVGRMPSSARALVERQFFAVWEHQTEPWPHWLQIIQEFKQALGALFNAPATEFCPQPNVSAALSKLIPALPKRSGKDVMVFSEHDFPSLGFVLKQAQRQGYRLKMLPTASDPQALKTWQAAFTDDVCGVLISHAQFDTGKLIPVEDITRLAREHEIISVVDIAQSGGVIPIDLQRWQADVVMGSCIKWLCGGPGAGFMWVQPGLIRQLEPADVGWFSHENPFEFDIKHFSYANDSDRFWGGTPSVLPYAIAGNSVRLIHTIGVDKIRAYNQMLTQRMVDSLDPAVLQSPVADHLRSGTLVLNFPESGPVAARLDNAGVVYDSRSLGMRLSPHCYNTPAEIERVIDCFS